MKIYYNTFVFIATCTIFLHSCATKKRVTNNKLTAPAIALIPSELQTLEDTSEKYLFRQYYKHNIKYRYIENNEIKEVSTSKDYYEIAYKNLKKDNSCSLKNV